MKSTPFTNKIIPDLEKDQVAEIQKDGPANTIEVPVDKNVDFRVAPLLNATKSAYPFTVVAIGASAGGLEAITELLQNLPSNTGMAFIYAQHLSPDHKSILTPLLSKTTKMKVQDIEEMDKIERNNVYVIPYNKEIEVTNGHI